MNSITPKAMDIVTEFSEEDFAILTNWRNPYTIGIHGDWRKQVRNALSNRTYHLKLSEKLHRFKPIVIVYTKLLFEQADLLRAARIPEATVCVICSSGEHQLTPWMIIHNIGHTLVSWNIWIKDDIMQIIGLTSHDDSVIAIQRDLVDCYSSRRGFIPNLNELIYELFTTWVWWGDTRSPHAGLRQYCNDTFPELLEKYRNKIVWHKYRCPVPLATPQPWLEEILSSLDGPVNYVPGVPGFTSKTLRQLTS